METMALISVIVPVYNAGGYLEDCLDSIVGQSYGNLEVILVDDGSTDGSSGVCDEFAGRDGRIRVIHQENMGAAAARRTGVLAAAGDYLCFVDADDRIDAEMVAFFVENMGACDILTSGCCCEDKPGIYHVRMDSLEEGLYDTEESMSYLISNMIAFQGRFEDGILPFLVNKMYRAEIVKESVQQIDFTIVYAEDRDLLFHCILRSERIKIVHKNFYYYRYKPDSIMRTVNKNFMSDLNKLYLSLEKTFKTHPQKKSILQQLELFILSRIYTIPAFMGFSAEAQISGYVFPFSELARGSRIVLYGAGRVGARYYRQIHRQNQLQMVLWADKKWREYSDSPFPISSPEGIRDVEYDYIIIAVKQKELAERIREELEETGADREQILWRPPAVL